MQSVDRAARVLDILARDGETGVGRNASELGVRNVVTFSGCPGDSEHSIRPNWVTCPWPPDFLETLEWQWTERAAPYWTDLATFARDHGVRIAVELHPGFLVYNTDSFLRLREIGGDAIDREAFDAAQIAQNPFFCPDSWAAARWEKLVDEAISALHQGGAV